MATIIPIICALPHMQSAMVVGANHWPKHWPATVPDDH